MWPEPALPTTASADVSRTPFSLQPVCAQNPGGFLRKLGRLAMSSPDPFPRISTASPGIVQFSVKGLWRPASSSAKSKSVPLRTG